MFAEHQPKLAALGRSGSDGFERIMTFVLCTIRQTLRIAAMDYKLVRQGDESSLFGYKPRGLHYVRRNASELLERCEYAWEHSCDDDAENVILGILTEIPSIGLAKAGFVCQMLYGLSGCLDTHNLTRFGIPERSFRGKEAKISIKRFGQNIRDYNAICRRLGGTAYLWDSWCEYVSQRDPINYRTPEIVSALHLIPLEV